jgi:hypothetical protein
MVGLVNLLAVAENGELLPVQRAQVGFPKFKKSPSSPSPVSEAAPKAGCGASGFSGPFSPNWLTRGHGSHFEGSKTALKKISLISLFFGGFLGNFSPKAPW